MKNGLSPFPSALDLKGTTSLSRLAREKTETWFLRQGEKRALQLFQAMAKRVPAYKKFLKTNGVRASQVQTMNDFQKLPDTDKKNYIQHYSLEERSWDGSLGGATIIAASSGTTGAPTLWPRGIEQEAEAVRIHEHLFTDLYEIDSYKTLAIIGFPMGVYVSGIATTLPSFLVASKHSNLTLLTAGNNRESVLSTFTQLQKNFEQVILIGHPFFVKDIIETGSSAGINWSQTKFRTLFASEGFTEEWRTYLSSLVPTSIPEKDFFSTYGSSELLLMGYETPFTIRIRQASEQNPLLQKTLFNAPSTPSLFQYNPLFRHIDVNEKNELLFTASSGIPLVRFNLHDLGSTLSFEHIEGSFKDSHQTLPRVEKGEKRWNFPFVSLRGRSDYTLVFYAANIYPEHIREALNHKSFLKKITGKFTMEKKYTASKDQQLIIHIELQENERVSQTLTGALQKQVVHTLEEVNMEYRFLRDNLKKDIVPMIVLHPYRDSQYFPLGLKPRYIIS